MQKGLTASFDACQSSALCPENDAILWLEPHSARPACRIARTRKALSTLTTSFGLGACLTVASASGATEPAQAAESHIIVTASADPAPILIPEPVDRPALPEAAPPPALQASAPDPLAAIVPELPATLTGSQVTASIIVSMPLASAAVAEGSNDGPAHPAAHDMVDFEDMRVPRWIVDTILRASDVTGVDPVYMMALADKESSFIPANRASTSSAEGLFQFIASTWLDTLRSFGPKHGLTEEAAAIQLVNGQLTVPNDAMREHVLGLRRNPYISALMAAEMMKRDKAKIEARLGRRISRSEFYLAHFFGVDSASKFIALVDDTPKKSASRTFPAAARSNRALFYAKQGKKTRQLSVAEVYGKLDTMMDKRLGRYEDVSTRVAGATF